MAVLCVHGRQLQKERVLHALRRLCASRPNLFPLLASIHGAESRHPLRVARPLLLPLQPLPAPYPRPGFMLATRKCC